jgi:hypothetical protein
MGTIIFKLKDQTEFIIYDTLYSNSREMKIFLENYYGDVVDGHKPVLAERVLHDSFETFYTYKGNLFTSFRFYFLIFWIVVMFKAFQTVFYFEFVYGIVFGSFLVIVTLLMPLHFNYFQLSDQTLTVNNHFYFWNRSRYRLGSIRNVIFEKHSRGPKSLRIIQNDFKEYNFPAASLNEQDWIDLKKNLEAASIPVDVENLN